MTGVLIVRDDGVIVVPNAIPWPAVLAATVEHLLGNLGAPRDREQNIKPSDNNTGQEAET